MQFAIIQNINGKSDIISELYDDISGAKQAYLDYMIQYYKKECGCIGCETYVRQDIPKLVEIDMKIISTDNNDAQILELHEKFHDQAKINDDDAYNKAIDLRKEYYTKIVKIISENISNT